MVNTIKKSKKELRDWRVLEFYVPIEESFAEGDAFIIKGVAINETTTLNNVKYVAEELEKAAPTFRNVPILLDHKNEIKSIVGRTTEKVDWNPSFNRVDFEAKIMDDDIIEMIKDGRIGSVSIGAKVQDLTEEEDGSMKAIGIHGLEISLVAVPGDSHANLAQAMQQGLTLKERAGENNYKFKKEDKMAEEEEKTEEVQEEKEEVVAEPAEEPKEEVAEEKVQKIDVKVDTTEIADMKAQLAELKGLLMEKKKIQEQVEDEKESEEEKEPEDETKGEVSTEAEEKLEVVDNLIVEAVGRDKFSMYKDYSTESTNTNLKRLVR